MNHLYQSLADAVLIVHASFVVFVVGALILTIVGGYLQWSWVLNWWFRVVHLVSITLVVAQSWAGLICSLTSFEMWLRGQAGDARYEGSFVQYWLQRYLYYDAPEWVFILGYTIFGSLVVITWVRFPPQTTASRRQDH